MPDPTQARSVAEVLLAHERSPIETRELRPRRSRRQPTPVR
jgi:hypothetical protein